MKLVTLVSLYLGVALAGSTVATTSSLGRTQSAGDSNDRVFQQAFVLDSRPDPTAGVSLGDIDADGDLDVVLAKGRHLPFIDEVFVNDGQGRFTSRALNSVPDRSYSAALSDLDGDGDLDIVVSNDRPDAKLVYVNDGTGKFQVGGTWGIPEWPTRNIAVVDVNGDDRPDIIAANRPGPSAVCLNNGKASFGECSRLEIGSAATILTADFDRDGAMDLAIPHRDKGQSLIYFNNGGGQFTRTTPFGPATSAARAGATGDLNGDGWPDVVVGDEKAGVFVHLNNRKGEFRSPLQLRLGEVLSPFGAAIADLNRDGHGDIVVGYTGAPGSVLVGDGSGERYSHVRFGDGRGAVYGVALGDLNRDGYLDIAAASSGAPTALFFSERGRAGRTVVALGGMESPIPLLEGRPASPENPVLGVWHGTVASRDPYQIDLLVERLRQGEAAGRTLYHRRGVVYCSVTHSLEATEPEARFFLKETRTAGFCGTGWVRVRLQDAGTMLWDWFGEASSAKPEVTAVLTRKKAKRQ